MIQIRAITYTNKKKTEECGCNMGDNLVCKFCGEEFQKGWDSSVSMDGWDKLITHVSRRHMREWGQVRKYSINSTMHKERAMVEEAGNKHMDRK